MAVTLWLVTIWIPYLNIGTTIAFITFVVMFVLFVLAASIAMAIEASFWKQLKDHSRRRTALVPSFFIRDQLFYRKTINIICFSKINTNFALSKLKNEQACRTKKDCTGIYC